MSITNMDEIELLEKHLSGLSVPHLPHKRELELKRRIFTAIVACEKNEFLPYQIRNLVVKIREVGQKTVAGFIETLRMKEKLINFAERSSVQTQGFQMGIFGNFRYFRPVFAGILLFAFAISSVFLVPLQIPIIHAARSTYFEEVAGKVFVLRNSRFLPATASFSLQEGDVILTKENGFASVRFFDDSVSRLAENTQMVLKRLSYEQLNPIATQVELLLQSGRSWFRVLNLVDEKSLFAVQTSQVAASVSKRAAFDLQVRLHENYLSVFDNVVDYSLASDFLSQPKSLLAGFQAHVSGSGKVKTSAIVESDTDEHDPARSAEWVKENLKRDKIYGDRVVVEKEKALTVVDKTDGSPREKFNTDDNKVLSNKELEKLRSQFLDSHKRFLLGATFLMRQQAEEGLRLIYEFKNTVKVIMARLKDTEKTDLMNAGLLRSIIEAKIAQQRKDVATLLPKDALYPLKQILAETEILLVDSDVGRTKLHLSHLESRLLEAQELAKNEKFDDAENILKKYERDIRKVALQVRYDNFDELNSKVVSLLNQQINQIKALTAIEKSLYPAKNRLLSLVRDLRYELLEKVITTSGDAEGTLPVVLLQQLKDLLQTYMADGAFDREFVALLNKLLQKSNNKVLTEAQAKLPEELGFVKLVDEEVSSEFGFNTESSGDDGGYSDNDDGDKKSFIEVKKNVKSSLQNQR